MINRPGLPGCLRRCLGSANIIESPNIRVHQNTQENDVLARSADGALLDGFSVGSPRGAKTADHGPSVIADRVTIRNRELPGKSRASIIHPGAAIARPSEIGTASQLLRMPDNHNNGKLFN